MHNVLQDPFREAFRGRFHGVLRWPQLDALWVTVRTDLDGGWYVYAIGESPPDEPMEADQLDLFLNKVDQLLREEHQEDYCGVVYTDSYENPSFIKIFDPHNLGVSCGFSDNPPLPGWILSKLPPSDLNADQPSPGNRRRWWQRLFG